MHYYDMNYLHFSIKVEKIRYTAPKCPDDSNLLEFSTENLNFCILIEGKNVRDRPIKLNIMKISCCL